MKTKRIIAAVFAFAIAAANFSATAFAAEEAPTKAAAEAVSTDITEISQAAETTETTETAAETEETQVTSEIEEAAETTTETEEAEGTVEDTTITEELNVCIKSGETFTIGDESFTASIESGVLKIYNDRSLAFEKQLYGIAPTTESVALSVNGNTLNIKEYDASGRLLHDNYVEYNPSTGKFGDIEYSNSYEKYSFDFQGMSFYAVITRETKERISAEGWTEYDQYNYLSINFADGTPTNIQNELVWVEYGRTGGFAGYEPASYIITLDDKLTIRRIVDSDDSSQDILTTYVFDKEANDFVLSGSSSDAQEVTEQMLIDKFTENMGKPLEYQSGDFNKDGVLDMYCSILGSGSIDTYFVTMDSIILVSSNPMWIGGSSETHCYFTLNDGNIFRFTFRYRSSAGYIVAVCSIEKINSDGTLSPSTINGEDNVCVLYDDAILDDGSIEIDYTKYITSEQTGDPYTFFSANGDSITIKRYIFDTDNDAVDSTNYVYDEANNAFVSSGSTNNSGNSSNGSTSSVSNSPATSDNFAVIPFTLSIALVAGAAAVVGIKNRRKQK